MPSPGEVLGSPALWEDRAVDESAETVVGPATLLTRHVELLMLSPPADPVAHGDALTPHQASEFLGVERSAVVGSWRALASEYAASAERAGWAERLRSALDALEGLGTLRELAELSAADQAGRISADAYALTRATLESNLHPDLVWRRSGVTVLVTSKRGFRSASVDPNELMGHASELRHVVSGLVASGDVVSIGRLEQAVAISPELRTLSGLTGSRLSDLAAAQLLHVLSNRRGDLYLADLKPAPALAAVADTLPSREVTVEELQRRVRGRFPGALPLPDRYGLDDAVLAATGRVWGTYGYRPAR